ncbi:MAG: hypothetical protein IPM39_05785 [Chloroflexi bacterium]|nr:hypothetical protein [Chloroflexota bacterium]
MTQTTSQEPNLSKVQRVIYTIMPLFLLLLCLGVINFVSDEPAAEMAALVTGGETAVPLTPIPAASATPPPATTTPTVTPTPTPTALPTLPPEAAITLLGPPDGSVFSAATALSLYWAWPYPLREDQFFAIYLAGSGDERRLGELLEPNLGDNYYWQLRPSDLTGLGADLTWQIRLESTLLPAPQLTSGTRTIRLLGGN